MDPSFRNSSNYHLFPQSPHSFKNQNFQNSEISPDLEIMVASYPLYFLAAFAFGFAILKIAKILLLMWIRSWRSFEDRLHFFQFYKIPEFSDSFHENQLYRQVSVYLSSLISLEDSDFTNIFSGRKPNEFSLQLDSDRSIVPDSFLGANVSWKSDVTRCRMFVLKIRKEDKRRILRLYLQHIQTVADEIDQKKRDVRLFSNVRTDDFGIGRWRSVPFTHPSTIETIAMDSDLKNKIRSDLDSFLKAKQYYHRLGRVWKRSYLLYGPAGTGKTTFVAAMARFLCYDVYDVDLSRIGNDSELKSLLLQTSGKSVILIEDLDRFLSEKSEVSLSGVLNFMDGIFSCCAEERVMVFTMNSKKNIDPAIFRPGRLDVHIYFPLCDFPAFKSLVGSYLGVKDHRLFPHVEEVFRGGASLSPAEIGEILIANRSSPSRALKSVISALQSNGGGSVSVKIGRTMSESGSENGRSDVSEKSDGAVVRRDSSVYKGREFRRLYGLLRMK